MAPTSRPRATMLVSHVERERKSRLRSAESKDLERKRAGASGICPRDFPRNRALIGSRITNARSILQHINWRELLVVGAPNRVKLTDGFCETANLDFAPPEKPASRAPKIDAIHLLMLLDFT